MSPGVTRRRRRGLGLLVAVALAVVGAAALAMAQDVVLPIKLTAEVRGTPSRAGTPERPRGVKFHARAWIKHPDGGTRPLLQTIDVWLPKVGVFNHRKYQTCDLRRLSEGGPRRCPRGSIVGNQTYWDIEPDDRPKPHITVINGGADKVYLWVVLTNPARVAAPVVATITRIAGSRRWGAKAHVELPRYLQLVVGIPIHYETLSFTLGRKDWIASTNCPRDGQWRYHVLATFDNRRTATFDGGVPCLPPR